MLNRRHLVGLALTLAVAACGAGSTPSPTPAAGSPTPLPSPTPTAAAAGVTSAAQAAALVLASDPRFGAIRPADPDVIGGCCSYEAVDAQGGYEVTVKVGWGDCPAGCINQAQWQFHVDPDGTISTIGQTGDGGAPVPQGEGELAGVKLHLRAGPTCPVAHDPPDPSCAAQPVANAEVVVRNPDGTELARSASNDQGEIDLRLPPGAYYVEPQPAQGLMGTAPAVAFSVVGGEAVDINLDYDTGIR